MRPQGLLWALLALGIASQVAAAPLPGILASAAAAAQAEVAGAEAEDWLAAAALEEGPALIEPAPGLQLLEPLKRDGDGGAAAGAAAAAGDGDLLEVEERPVPRLLAESSGSNSSSNSSSGDGGGSGSGSGTTAAAAESPPASGRCRPSLRTVARRQPQLRQAVALAEAGYDMFSVDGGKPFTVLAPSNRALQALAGFTEDADDQLQLEDGFYSVVLYHQLPQGALDVGELVAKQGPDGLLTSLGKALGKEKYSVSFDNSTAPPVVATGGWPANNAAILSSHKACNGWLHIIDNVLLPAQQFSDLPRLVDEIPNLQNGTFWALLDGSAFAANDSDALAPAPDDGLGGPPSGQQPSPPTNGSGIIISDGDGSGSSNGTGGLAPHAASAGSSDNKMLVVAASVAGAAVAACALLVGGVLLRKRQLRRRRTAQHGRLQEREEEEERFAVAPSKSSMRPVQVHVDA